MAIACCFFFLLSNFMAAQHSRLTLNLEPDDYENEYNVAVMLDSIIIHSEVFYSYTTIFLDHLQPGNYQIALTSSSAIEKSSYSKFLLIQPDKEYKCYISINTDIESWDLTDKPYSERENLERGEIQLSMNYGHKSIYDMASYRRFFSVSEDSYVWLPANKHIGQLLGGGISFSRYLFDEDSTFHSEVNPIIKKKYYALDLQFKYFIRFSQKTQISDCNDPVGAFMDLGAGYYFPVYFRQNIQFINDVHLTQAKIHKYNDFRAIAVVGYYPFAISFEYRLNDIVKKNLPQLPPWEIGLKILIGG